MSKRKRLTYAINESIHCKVFCLLASTMITFSIHDFIVEDDVAIIHLSFIVKNSSIFNAHDSTLHRERVDAAIAYLYE